MISSCLNQSRDDRKSKTRPRNKPSDHQTNQYTIEAEGVRDVKRLRNPTEDSRAFRRMLTSADRREDPGTQRNKTIADWCIPLRFHTCALIGLFLQKQRRLPFKGFVEAEKCFLQCLRPKRWTEVRSDCSENCDCTVGRQRFEYSDI